MNIYILRIFVNIIGVVMMWIQWNREEFMRVCYGRVIEN